MDINKLKKKKQALVREMRGLLDTAALEERELSPEEVKLFDDLDNQVTSIRGTLDKVLQVVGHEKKEPMDEDVPVADKEEAKPESRQRPIVEVLSSSGETAKVRKEHRSAFAKYIVGAPMTKSEVRALEAGTAAEGGNLVPVDFAAELDKRLANISRIRQLGRSLKLDRSMAIPVHTTKSAAAVRGEEADVSGSVTQPAFGQEILNYWEIYHEVVFSRELKNQSAINLEDFLLDEMAYRIAYKEEQLIVSGGGSTEPTGLDLISTVGGVSIGTITQATTAVVTLAELTNLYYTLPLAYRDGAVFMMNDNTHKYIMSILDEVPSSVGTPADAYTGQVSSRRLFAPDPRMAFGDQIFGKEVLITDHLAGLGGDNVPSIVLVNPKHMVIGDFGGLNIARADGDLTLMRQGQEAIAAFKGIDMKMNSPDALVQYVCANI